MQFWLSEQARLFMLILLCALLWTLESIVPLYRFGRDRWPHALPNVLLAALLILTSDGIDRFLRLFVVTPNMHKVHHSRRQKQTDSNFSNIFSIWDRLGGTYTARVNFGELRYGLDGFDDMDKQTLRGLMKMPFVKCD